MDTSQNISLSKIAQVTAIIRFNPNKSQQSEDDENQPIRSFRSITKASVGVSSNSFYKSNNVSPSKANSRAIFTFFALCQLLIGKLFVTIYVSALYKATIVSIDDKIQPM